MTLLLETVNIQEAIAEEQSLPPGLYEVRLSIISPLSQEELDDLHAYFLDRGVDIKGCLQQRIKGLYQIRIKYQKHPLSEGIAQASLLIPLIPVFLLAVLVGIGIFKASEIIGALTPIIFGIIGFGVVALVIVRKPLERAAKKYVERA